MSYIQEKRFIVKDLDTHSYSVGVRYVVFEADSEIELIEFALKVVKENNGSVSACNNLIVIDSKKPYMEYPLSTWLK